MKFLVIGGGGREHAIAWKLAQSNLTTDVFVAPGNAGTCLEYKVKNTDIQSTDIPALVEFAKNNNIECTIVGPEAPLTMGISDEFEKNGLHCVGVNKMAAQLESSKLFTKNLLKKYSIPTADFIKFTDYDKAVDYCNNASYPLVIKADGLAEGKGVIMAADKAQALEGLKNIMQLRIFGAAGDCVVIEEHLLGFETSAIAIVNGTEFIPFVDAQDHKRLENGDKGPNTGGMGVFSPSPHMTKELSEKINVDIMKPLLKAIKSEGISYNGFIFVGLMVDNNQPKVLEINCRLGDPETQAILLRMDSDFAKLMALFIERNLRKYKVRWTEKIAVSVVMAAKGYPIKNKKGDIIQGLKGFKEPRIKIFHAGTQYNDRGDIVVSGGRVISVCSLGDNIEKSRKQVYNSVNCLSWDGCQFRTDI